MRVLLWAAGQDEVLGEGVRGIDGCSFLTWISWWIYLPLGFTFVCMHSARVVGSDGAFYD